MRQQEPEVVMREKKIAPAKPKRKSICATPMSEKKARVRYYDEKQDDDESGKIQFQPDRSGIEKSEPEKSGENQTENSPSYEQKRQRLLKKVELAKQVKNLTLINN